MSLFFSTIPKPVCFYIAHKPYLWVILLEIAWRCHAFGCWTVTGECIFIMCVWTYRTTLYVLLIKVFANREESASDFGLVYFKVVFGCANLVKWCGGSDYWIYCTFIILSTAVMCLFVLFTQYHIWLHWKRRQTL